MNMDQAREQTRQARAWEQTQINRRESFRWAKVLTWVVILKWGLSTVALGLDIQPPGTSVGDVWLYNLVATGFLAVLYTLRVVR